MKTFSIKSTLSLLTFMILLLPVSSLAGERDISRLEVGYSIKSFIDVDIKDATEALNIWVKELGKTTGYNVNAKIYMNSKELLSDFTGGKLDYVAMRTSEYLEDWSKVKSRMAFGAIRGGKKMRRFLLLVHEDSDILHLEEMKDMKLVTVKNDEIGRIYISTLLLEQGSDEVENYFSDVVEKEKPSKAILSVFFRQFDACIINEHSFNLMKELNPQIGTRLRVIASSQEILETVSFFKDDLNDTMIKNVLKDGLNLGDSERGRQVLVLFKLNGLFHLKLSDLDSVKELYEKYQRLKRLKQKI